MILLQDIFDKGVVTKEEFWKAKMEYLTHIAPMIKSILRLIRENSSLIHFGTIWVTDYGDLSGNERDDDTLANIFTYNGSNICSVDACYCMDIAFECEQMELGEDKAKADERIKKIHKEISKIMGDYYDDHWYRLESSDLEDYYNRIGEVCDYLHQIQSVKKMKSIKKFMWKASSNDGAFEDKSAHPFDSAEECYNDMRNAVLEKMKWNTEWLDFEGEGNGKKFIPYENSAIGYEVVFKPFEIVHTSYSGVYTYKVVEYKEEETYRLTSEISIACDDAEHLTKMEEEFKAFMQNAVEQFKMAHPTEVGNIGSGYAQHIK